MIAAMAWAGFAQVDRLAADRARSADQIRDHSHDTNFVSTCEIEGHIVGGLLRLAAVGGGRCAVISIDE